LITIAGSKTTRSRIGWGAEGRRFREIAEASGHGKERFAARDVQRIASELEAES